MEQTLSLGLMASAMTPATIGCEQFCSRAFRHRERIAAAGTAISSIFLLLALQFVSAAPPDMEPEPMPIELVHLPPPPKEPVPVPEKPLPPPPKASVQPKQESPPPAPVAQVKPAPAMAESAPALPVQAQQPVAPPKAVEPPQQHSNPAAESGYQARARAEIDKQKRYPEEAQQLGMTGSVLVSYTIARDGRLLRAEIAQSSGFKLLDQAALQAVQRTSFEAMPTDAWIGIKEQSFRTRIAFTLD